MAVTVSDCGNKAVGLVGQCGGDGVGVIGMAMGTLVVVTRRRSQ